MAHERKHREEAVRIWLGNGWGYDHPSVRDWGPAFVAGEHDNPLLERIAEGLAAATAPTAEPNIDDFHSEKGFEVCTETKGWLVATGINGESFNPAAFFFDEKRAQQYCELEVDDGCGGTENVAFDACAQEAIITRGRIVVSNDYTIESHEQLLARVDQALAAGAPK